MGYLAQKLWDGAQKLWDLTWWGAQLVLWAASCCYSGVKEGVGGDAERRGREAAGMGRVQEQGLDVGPCRVMVLVYNEDRARPRNIRPQHIDGANEGLIDALDALEDGDTAAAAEAFGNAWLGTYGIDVAAEVTDVVGTFALG